MPRDNDQLKPIKTELDNDICTLSFDHEFIFNMNDIKVTVGKLEPSWLDDGALLSANRFIYACDDFLFM